MEHIGLRELPVGAEVSGIDLATTVGTEEREELLEVFARRHLLLFRGQCLTGARQVEITSMFGPILPEKGGDFGYVSNVVHGGVVPEGALPFHSDFAFTVEPVLAISLHALVVPSNGGVTNFADAIRALHRMPTARRTKLEHLDILNVYDFGLPSDRRMRLTDLSAGSPICWRPFVGHHPRTGDPVINANAMHTDSVVGLAPDASEDLLAEVFASLYAPEHVLQLDWKVGDFVLWDNIAVHHGRRDFPPTEERTLQRVCLGTKSASELVPNLADLLARAHAQPRR